MVQPWQCMTVVRCVCECKCSVVSVNVVCQWWESVSMVRLCRCDWWDQVNGCGYVDVRININIHVPALNVIDLFKLI